MWTIKAYIWKELKGLYDRPIGLILMAVSLLFLQLCAPTVYDMMLPYTFTCLFLSESSKRFRRFIGSGRMIEFTYPISLVFIAYIQVLMTCVKTLILFFPSFVFRQYSNSQGILGLNYSVFLDSLFYLAFICVMSILIGFMYWTIKGSSWMTQVVRIVIYASMGLSIYFQICLPIYTAGVVIGIIASRWLCKRISYEYIILLGGS